MSEVVPDIWPERSNGIVRVSVSQYATRQSKSARRKSKSTYHEMDEYVQLQGHFGQIHRGSRETLIHDVEAASLLACS